MSFPRPDDLPEWATANYTDPVSLVDNKVDPPAEKKLNGWYVRESPPSNWFNFWQNLVYKWIGYLDQSVTDLGFEKIDISADITLPAMPGASIIKVADFTRIGDIGFVSIKLAWTNNLLVAANTPLTISGLPYVSKNTVNAWGLTLNVGGLQTTPLGSGGAAGLIPISLISQNSTDVRVHLMNTTDGAIATTFAVGGSVAAGSYGNFDLNKYPVGSFDITGWYHLAT